MTGDRLSVTAAQSSIYLAGKSFGDDGHNPGQVDIVGAKDERVVCLDQVGKEAVDVGRLVTVLSHRQPGKPKYQDESSDGTVKTDVRRYTNTF